MDIQDYPSNSHKSKKEEAEKKEFVPSKDIEIRQTSPAKKLLKSFVSEDLADIKEAVIYDYIVPGIKDIILSTMDMIFGGGSYSRRGSYRDRDRSRASYDDYYSKRRRDDDRRSRREDRERDDRRRISYDDILYKTRPKAEEVRRDLFDAFDQYEVVSVSDFYDILKDNGVYVDDRDRAYTDNKYGWYDLGPCHIDPVRGGYILNLPKPVVLD